MLGVFRFCLDMLDLAADSNPERPPESVSKPSMRPVHAWRLRDLRDLRAGGVVGVTTVPRASSKNQRGELG